MIEEKYIVGIDAGTSVIKAVLFNLEGKEIDKHSISIDTESPKLNWVEEDMCVIWDNVKKCIKAITNNTNKDRILGIGITAQGDGTWLINKNGNPVRKGICWCDGRSAKIINEWYKNDTAKDAFKICGTAINTGTQCAQLKWLEDNEPESLENSQIIFHAKDWIFYKLTGEITTDETDESLPMLNMETRQYDKELFDIFGLSRYREKFPEVKKCSKNSARINSELVDELNLQTSTIVSSGPMDVSACALGLGAINEGQACSILGTAGIHEVVMSSPELKPELVGMTICHCKENSWIRIIASMTATPNLEWFKEQIGNELVLEAKNKDLDIYELIDEKIKNTQPGSRGIIYHPYLFPGGERGPFVNPNARASFTGLNLNHTTNDLLRSVFEGVAFAMRDCYSNVPIKINEIRLSGGGAKSEAWCQIFSDILNKKIILTEGEELGAKGAALNCGVSIGVYDSYAVKRTVKEKKSFCPEENNRLMYDKLFNLYRVTYKKLMDTWKMRANIMEEYKLNE